MNCIRMMAEKHVEEKKEQLMIHIACQDGGDGVVNTNETNEHAKKKGLMIGLMLTSIKVSMLSIRA